MELLSRIAAAAKEDHGSVSQWIEKACRERIEREKAARAESAVVQEEPADARRVLLVEKAEVSYTKPKRQGKHKK